MTKTNNQGDDTMIKSEMREAINALWDALEEILEDPKAVLSESQKKAGRAAIEKAADCLAFAEREI